VPHCDVAGLSIEQFPATDIGRGMAARYNIPLFDSVGRGLDARRPRPCRRRVLLVGEHGDYPVNPKVSTALPATAGCFEEIVKVFRRSGRSVPVYNDKHFSYSWPDAAWMYRQSRGGSASR